MKSITLLITFAQEGLFEQPKPSVRDRLIHKLIWLFSEWIWIVSFLISRFIFSWLDILPILNTLKGQQLGDIQAECSGHSQFTFFPCQVTPSPSTRPKWSNFFPGSFLQTPGYPTPFQPKRPEDFHRLRSEMDQLQKELEHQMDRRRALQAAGQGLCSPFQIR